MVYYKYTNIYNNYELHFNIFFEIQFTRDKGVIICFGRLLLVVLSGS